MSPKLFASICAALVLLASIVQAARPAGAAAPDPTGPYQTGDPGQRLFVKEGCYQCHGLVGQGSILSGPGLAPLRLDDAGFRAYVRNPKGAMPPYSQHILPDADLDRIERYIRSIPAGRTYRAIPVLAALVPAAAAQGLADDAGPAGDALYARNCAGCHGAALEGGIGPSLKGEARKRDAAAIVRLIVDPPAGMPKLFPAALTREQVDRVAAFVADASGR